MKLTVRQMMVAVAFAAVLIWGVTEFLVNRPHRQARQQRIAYHRNQAELLANLRENCRHLLTSKLACELEELSMWHRRRAQELRKRLNGISSDSGSSTIST